MAARHAQLASPRSWASVRRSTHSGFCFSADPTARLRFVRRGVDGRDASILAVPTPAVVPTGLVYVHDGTPGITRRRCGTGFVYCSPDGRRLTDAAQLRRIRALAIPPAYTRVWICARSDGHLQATGRDARGRKQYRYHDAWRAAQDADKYSRMQAFALALPRIRAAVRRDLARPAGQCLERAGVVATIVRLLDTTLARVGNDSYAKANGSYGLTTLRNRHAQVRGSEIRLRFKGKSGVQHEVSTDDPRAARVVRRCQSLPGQELFQYLGEDGLPRAVGSDDVNRYLREASGGDFTAKDFRTWHGSVHALELVRCHPCAPDASQTARSAAAKAVLAQVAARLGNTVAVCRKAYVHPEVLALLTGAVRPGCLRSAPARKTGLRMAERRLLAFLRTLAPAH